ncbi:hypothetical protein CVT25_002799 [Psilocybe cyanescens]|uniref:pyranose dehydrogenase (acceptor) n=1 Tax=Psilocybe cyanescens TaxID=93625 RepID=A0A409WKY2_PSICY|nr:hypothetical protein CVT25_002799 [Psilocybe cyanescens]
MPFISVEEATHKPYDFVVIGGGTAGLAAAVRLSESPSVTVLVLEAGRANLDDPKINIPGQFGATLGDPEYDWAFFTVKQENVNNREMIWSRGKGLGGTSAMNFYAWIKPPAEDINAFEQLGNPGWNWEDFKKYSKRSETFHPPTEEATGTLAHTYNLEHRGMSGPVQVTISSYFHTLDTLFKETTVNMGLNTVQDPYGGDINGTWIASANLNPKDWTRSSSANGYLFPNIERPNLSVLTDAMVSRVILEPKEGEQDRTVSGVEFSYKGITYLVKVAKEVVLSAGAIKSPQILELSGIGQPAVIAALGVEPQINLSGVGENVQEHIFNTLVCELDPATPHETLDLLLDPEYAVKAQALHALGQGVYTSSLTSFAYFPLHQIDFKESIAIIDKLEKVVDAQEKQGVLAPGLLEQLRLQISILRDERVPDCEVILYPGAFPGKISPELGKSYCSLGSFLNHPISRGSIHAQNSDPASHPKIDPRYFESDTDLEILVQHFKFTRKMLETEPLKSTVLCEVLPGPKCQTDSQIKEFLKKDLSSTWHTVGSCSMLPRKKGGVVDPQLKVYGTKNLRIADISIIPLHINAHPQTTAYVIGEKVAVFIKVDSDK